MNALIKEAQTDSALLAGYQRAKILYEGAYDIHKLVLNNSVVPYWLSEHSLWYRRRTRQGSEFRLVDARAGTNHPAFDHQALASALDSCLGQPVAADKLPITNVVISLQPFEINFDTHNRSYVFYGETGLCSEVKSSGAVHQSASDFVLDTDMFQSPSTPMSGDKFVSPDGKKAVFVRDYNLWLEDLDSGEISPLTQDGEALFPYATTPIALGFAGNAEIQALWSPDSKRLLTVQTDNRQVKTIPIVHHVPEDDSLRPTVSSYPYALPGDDYMEAMRLVAIDVERAQVQEAKYQYLPVQETSCHGLFVYKQAWWSTDNRRAYFIDLERGAQNVRLMEFDTYTGSTRCLFEETSETYIKLSCYGEPTLRSLPDSEELIWYSERSGWAHLYLYDLKTGALKNAITQGEWLVRSILHFDAERRECWIQTAGRVENRDPYYQDICRVNIDTGELTTVITGDEEYTVLAPGALAHYMARYSDPDRFINANAISPQAQYIVTTRSRADQVPVSLLLNRQGETVLELDTADVSALPENWQWPEPVQLLAADGKTAIYGTVFRPSDFSKEKSYPVIDFAPYPPGLNCVPKGAFRNNDDGGFFYPQAAALAELGFIVVTINGRGSPAREKAFSHANYGSVKLSNRTEDRISGIQQLANQYTYMDLNRVGILSPTNSEWLLHPDFYKVGVYNSGVIDERFVSAFFVETYQNKDQQAGELKTEEELAKQLQAQLLLICNLASTLNPPAATLRFVDALQQANKDFDLLVFPGRLPERYIFRRTLDYFVKHLQGVEPPKAFSFEPDNGQAV